MSLEYMVAKQLSQDEFIRVLLEQDPDLSLEDAASLKRDALDEVRNGTSAAEVVRLFFDLGPKWAKVLLA
jgi:hypothetical protein